MPTATYHLISRFVDREWYIRKESERVLYLKLLGRALSSSGWKLFAFAVMSNHIHFGLVAGEDPLDGWVRRAHSPFADLMNRAYNRIGPMFVRGPKAYLVERPDVANLIAYIHNNPVRAGVVSRAGDSTWTSHQAYVGLADCPPWLHVDIGRDLLAMHTAIDFDEWIHDPARKVIDVEFTEEAHERELARIQREENAVRAQAEERPPAAAIVAAAAHAVGIPVEMVRSRSRGDAEVLARTVAVHCAVSWGLTGTVIANAVGISQPGVSVIRRRELDPRAAELVTTVQGLVRAK